MAFLGLGPKAVPPPLFRTKSYKGIPNFLLLPLDLMLALKVRSQKEKGEEVEAELQRQLGRLKGEVGNILV